ncbi:MULTISPECIES: twin-arginine translocase TatA/TatE family subunit [Actinomyces]|uniref:twin-arginine translocase TatA/TatE family subunit n=1 Tax=Actinomyces TaxID=1654 RepID=UPI00109E3575|nr:MULTISPECIES: twin-arginine translocase TatA/TatE family subunit [Actinomyces]
MLPGISGAEFFVLLLVVVIVVGPQRLPEYTRKLTQGVRRLRVFLDNTKAQIAEEVGPELGDLDLSDLDPRNYDPRKIVRDALGEDLEAIRRDLTNPFQSVVETAKEASNEAAAAVSGKSTGKSKSLSKMIEDKAEETRAARAASVGAATAAAARVDSAVADAAEPAQQQAEQAAATPQRQDKDPEQAAAEAAAVTAELPQVSAAAPTDSAKLALEAGETATAEIPEVQPAEPAEGAQAPETIAADGVESAALIPSTLGAVEQDGDGPRVRPVSPRDIVRAANEAARTRAEAALAEVG